MTLRARLTAAFLAVVLGPVLIGAVFVGATVGTVGQARSAERLSLAASAVATTLDARCHGLWAAAETLAALSYGGFQQGAGAKVVDRGLATSAWLEDGSGLAYGTPPPRPWADCAGGVPSPGPLTALVYRVEVRSEKDELRGYAVAAEPVDTQLVQGLARATGVGVTLLDGRDQPLSSVTGKQVNEIVGAAAGLARDTVGETPDGLYVRVVEPSPGVPLRLALSVARDDSQGLYAVLLGVVVMSGLLAIVAAWWLARSTTQPLDELADAADRVAGGDLDARVPVRSHDEVGKLATTFNRMTREMQAYVAALTASRDQLRGNLAILGDTLSSTHDVQRILKVILETAMAATGAQAGVVLSVQREEGRWPAVLVGECAQGLAERGIELADLRLRVGEGLLGGVAASGEPRNGRVTRDDAELSPNEPRCRTYIAVPFSGTGHTDGEDGTQGGGRLLGVLALYDRLGHDDFDDADLTTLRTFAGQAAVAVDNVLLHEEAQRLSLTDALTGLWNYRYLKESMRREVERASRFGRNLVVLALDLDRFKDVNDTYGHPAGDAVLVAVAARLQRETREVDLCFRQGGEEFVVLLPETDAAGGARAAERLCAAIRSTEVRLEPGYAGAPGTTINVTVSSGIAVFPDNGGTGQEVLEAADDALYAAKAAGRDTWRIAPVADGVGTRDVSGERANVAGQPAGGDRHTATRGASTGSPPPPASPGR